MVEVEQVIKYSVAGTLFDSKEEAEGFVKEQKIYTALADVVCSFYYTGIDDDEIIEGILEYRDELLSILGEVGNE